MAIRIDTVLSEQQHEQFRDEGFLLLRGIIEPSVIASALAVLQADDAKPEAKTAAATSCVTSALVGVVNELQGPGYPVAGFRAGNMPRQQTPDALWHVNPHMDLINPTIVPDGWAIGGFIFLTPVRPRGGAFMYGPGSTARLRARMANMSGEAGWGSTKSETIAGRVVECIADPGDVILFQHTMLHSFSPNTSDATTRHALRVGFHLASRVDPGDKPLDEYSTIEQANSMAWLHARYPETYPLIKVGDAATLDGIPASAHDLIKVDGVTHLYTVDPAHPTVIQRRRTTDFAAWEELEPLHLVDDPIRALHLEHRFMPTLTVVCDTDIGTWSRVFSASDDLRLWRQSSGMPHQALSRPHLVQEEQVGVFQSKKAYASLIFSVHDDRPSSVQWRSGGNREEFTCWRNQGVAFEGPADGRITDVWAYPSTPARHALVADVDGAAHYTDSPLQDCYEDPFKPFVSDDPSPHHLRIFERAQGFWLVTYNSGGSVRFGVVDWAQAPGVIRRLTTSRQFSSALRTVGLA